MDTATLHSVGADAGFDHHKTHSENHRRPRASLFGGRAQEASSPNIRILVLGASGVGTSTVSQVIAALLARRGLTVQAPQTPSATRRPGDPEAGPVAVDPRRCASTVQVDEASSWDMATSLLAQGVDRVVVVTSTALVPMQFAFLATRLAQHSGCRAVHLVVNRVRGNDDMERALRNLGAADPFNGSQYRSIHTLPEDSGSLPIDNDGWSDALAQMDPFDHSALVNAVGWLVEDLVPSPVTAIG